MRVDYPGLEANLVLSGNFTAPISTMNSDPNLLHLCLNQHNLTSVDQNVTAVLSCFAAAIGPDLGARQFTRSIGLVFAGALVFFMQAGFAMLCAGAVRKKNVQNTLLKNLLDACGASIAWFTLGYAFAFGGSQPFSPQKTFIGTSNFFFMDVKDPAYWFFQYAFSAASATIIAGTLAERCQMAAYFGYSIALVGWVYPVIVHAIWSPNGFLAADNVNPLLGVGMVDFAGSGVVHLTGGVTALFATIILGPRRGRFHDETGRKLDKPREFIGNSMSLQMLGTIVLWFGWYGFNSGSALQGSNPASAQIAALAAVNTTLSGGAAGIVALFLNLWVLERSTGEPYFDIKYAMNGSLCGLVAITGGCGVVEPWAAVLTGSVAGLLYIPSSNLLLKLRLDDAVDAIPVHMVSGLWGLLCVGLFASTERLQAVYTHSEHPGLFYSFAAGKPDGTLLACQVIGILFIMGWVMVFMLPFFVWLDWNGWFRSDPLEEIVGLDTSYHGGLALLSGEDHVDPEYITAFKEKRKETLRRRNVKRQQNSDTVSPDDDDPDEDDEDETGIKVIAQRDIFP